MMRGRDEAGQGEEASGMNEAPKLGNDFIPLMTAYSVTLRLTGPDSPEIARFREEHANVPGFLEYADALDRVNRTFLKRKDGQP